METEKCIHHWLIEPHITDTSLGRCKYCGETRKFYNVIRNFYEVAKGTKKRRKNKELVAV